jgi:large subunit ribosomal protein L3
MLGLLGKKLGQTSVYDARGVLVPVTSSWSAPTASSRPKRSNPTATTPCNWDSTTKKSIASPSRCWVISRNFPPAHQARARVPRFHPPVKPGDVVGPGIFAQGDFVDAIGVTKGRGFEGVMKRHNFRGGDASHGAKGWRRRSGAIGQRLFPGTVMRGMKMPGHMGQVRRTAQNLQIIQVREAENLLLIKGAIPGSNNDYVVIREAKKLPKGSDRAKRRLAVGPPSQKAAPAQRQKPPLPPRRTPRRNNL